jgi:hypothetical protein
MVANFVGDSEKNIFQQFMPQRVQLFAAHTFRRTR